MVLDVRQCRSVSHDGLCRCMLMGDLVSGDAPGANREGIRNRRRQEIPARAKAMVRAPVRLHGHRLKPQPPCMVVGKLERTRTADGAAFD